METVEPTIEIGTNLCINHKSITDILKVSEINMTVKAVRYVFFDSGEAKMYDCQDSKGQLWVIDRFGKFEFYFANSQLFKSGNKQEVKNNYKWMYENDQPCKIMHPYGVRQPFKSIESGIVDMSIGMNLPSKVVYGKWESVKEMEFPLCMYLETGAFDYKGVPTKSGGHVMFMSGMIIPKNRMIIK